MPFHLPLQIVALSPITPFIDPRTGKPSGAADPAETMLQTQTTRFIIILY